MTDTASFLLQMSNELAAMAERGRSFVAAVRSPNGELLTGILWTDSAVAVSEQALPDATDFEVTLGGQSLKAQLAGRDPGTNVAVLKLESKVASALPPHAAARVGTLALVLGAPGDGVCARLALVRAGGGGAWESLSGGVIDQRIVLDCPLRPVDEGGAVLAADGAILGMATRGAGRQSLVIPASTVERSVAHLLEKGSVQRGYLGVSFRPVALPETLRPERSQRVGLMVMEVGADSPAAKAGILVGDIVLSAGGNPATRFGAITRQLGPNSIGKTIAITLARAGSIVTCEAAIAARITG